MRDVRTKLGQERGEEIMHKGRVEAFTDGVVAILITIMVLELRPPEGHGLADLAPLVPTFSAYGLSFIFLGIYWNNHHHMMQAVRSINGPVLWANLHLLFWLSLVPFSTAWLGEGGLAAMPVAAYGVNLMMSAVAYTILAILLVRHEGPESSLARAMGRDYKGKASLACYAVAIPLAFVAPVVSLALYIAVAILWFLPDRRIERVLETGH